MGGAMKYFPKKLLGRDIFRSMASWATNFFFSEKFVKLSAPLLHTLRTFPYNHEYNLTKKMQS